MLRERKLNRRHKFLRGLAAVQVHVPALLNQPVFEILKFELAKQ